MVPKQVKSTMGGARDKIYHGWYQSNKGIMDSAIVIELSWAVPE